MNLKEWELNVLLSFLDDLDEKYSNAGCNDTRQEMIDLIPKDQLVEIDRKCWEKTGEPEEHDPKNPRIHLNDGSLLAYIQMRLKGIVD